MSRQFTCNLCRGTFETLWCDEEAEAELAAAHPGVATDDCAILCEDCFKHVERFHHSIAAGEGQG